MFIHLVNTPSTFTECDEIDHEYLNQFRWFISHYGYAFRRDYEKQTGLMMHVEVFARTGLIVLPKQRHDHIDQNKLNNKRNNLRLCTGSQNLSNKGRIKTNTSGYKGVCSSGRKWMAQITVNYKNIYLGTFPTKELAAFAYNEAAIKHFGEFASLNVIT